jgi:proteic killer suppression protein
VIKSFRNKGTEDLFNGDDTRAARRVCPEHIQPVARRKLISLNAATLLKDLTAPPSNRLESLKGDREGQHSIRINEQYRICFVWTGQDAENVEIVDYH